jgi:hypothetical protein
MADTIFIYKEIFSGKELRKIPNALNLDKTKNYKAVVFRLLSGTAKIEHVPSGILICPDKYYFDLSAEKVTDFYNQITVNISPYDIKLLSKHFDENIGKNYNFYRELFLEYAWYFYEVSSYRKNYTGGFFHLYRILESISYVFPLIWASKAKDGYYGTFEKMKDLFNNPTKGELGIFRLFIKSFLPEEELGFHFKLSLSSCNPKWLKGYYKIIEQNVKSEDIVDSLEPGLTDDSMPENVYITIKADAIIDLTINIRNKYFHFLTGEKQNFSSEQLGDPEEFFKSINEQIFTWLSYIFLRILIYEIES